ncbi:hypothetical protein CDL15_Pgr015260 [Punica granatum]|uniref:Uncharacterized protein n=1 Tax=Punica granatum TaxID=22663 RepID=A0A218VZB8_PUNGR|nr:hypothetical protein CDL15_Pgr015260 [Punica granatum]
MVRSLTNNSMLPVFPRSSVNPIFGDSNRLTSLEILQSKLAQEVWGYPLKDQPIDLRGYSRSDMQA